MPGNPANRLSDSLRNSGGAWCKFESLAATGKALGPCTAPTTRLTPLLLHLMIVIVLEGFVACAAGHALLPRQSVAAAATMACEESRAATIAVKQCRVIQGCSDVLKAGVSSLAEPQARPTTADVRCSILNAQQHFQQWRGPTDSVFLTTSRSATQLCDAGVLL